jgi:hypothetical protein
MITALADGFLVRWLVDPDALPSAAELVGSLRATLG